MPGLPEALCCESRCHIEVVRGSIILIFGFGRRDVADRLQQTAMVKPVDPFEGRVFHGFEGSPGSTAVDDLGLVKAVDRLGQSPFDKLSTGLS